MALLRMHENDVKNSISVEQLLADIQGALAAGIITPKSKVVQMQMCGHNVWPIKAVVAPGAADHNVLALSNNTEQELIDSGMFKQHGVD